MEPIEYLRALRAKWRIVVAAGLIGLAAAWFTTPARPQQTPGFTSFTATHTLILDAEGSEAKTLDLARAALLTRTGEVPRRVAQKLGVAGEPAVLAVGVTVTPDPVVRTISITVSDDDGPQAALLADTFAAELVSYLDEREIGRQQREVDVVTARMDSLQRQSSELDAQIPNLSRDRQPLARAQYDALVRQFGLAYERFQQLAAEGPGSVGLVTLEKATPIAISSGGFRAPSSRSGRMLIAGPFGMMLGAAAVLLLKRLDTRIHTKEEAEGAFRLPVIAEIPRLPRGERWRRQATVSMAGTSATASAYRTLRTSIRFMPPHNLGPAGAGAAAATGAGTNGGPMAPPGPHGARVLLVSSPGPREGKTAVVANLAISFARAAESVIALDFDLLRPDIATWLGRGAHNPVHGPPGLDELATDAAVPGIRIVTDWAAGRGPTEALELGRELVSAARRSAKVVLLDTPPLLESSDASELMPIVDAVVLVCRAGQTTAESAGRAAELLGRLGAAVLGVVLVGVPQPRRRRHRRPRAGALRPVAGLGPITAPRPPETLPALPAPTPPPLPTPPPEPPKPTPPAVPALGGLGGPRPMPPSRPMPPDRARPRPRAGLLSFGRSRRR